MSGDDVAAGPTYDIPEEMNPRAAESWPSQELIDSFRARETERRDIAEKLGRLTQRVSSR